MSKKNEIIGKPLDRVDGRLKVTGGARYSADMPVENLAYAVLITSSIGNGRIREMDTREAERLPGVLAILTPFNAPRLSTGSIVAQSSQQSQQGTAGEKGGKGEGERRNGANREQSHQQAGQESGQSRRPPDRRIHLLQEDTVFYNGQPIGLVVADTFEQAHDAATRVRVHYDEERPLTVLSRELHRAYKPEGGGSAQFPADTQKGSPEQGWRSGAARIEETYITPIQTHNALEPHATIALWNGDHLTLYDATQGIFNARKRVAALFEIAPESVRIISYFVGGGFGSKGPVWSHVVLAAMAARQVGRPVKLVLTRAQMFGPIGFRSETHQKLRLAATQEGALTLVQHDGIVQTSVFDEFVESVGNAARMLYASPNIATSHRAVRLNIGTPSYTRAPGMASGVFALECAMDELAYRLGMDPLELRLRNYAEADPGDGKPWSSKSLRECYRLGAQRFGWNRRTPQPRSMREGNTLVGYGMATAVYPTHRSPSSARARLLPNGTALVQSGTQDIGTGTYTIMTQIAAEMLGLPPDRVRFELGDTTLPETPVSGGSQTAASTGSAVLLATQALRSKLIRMALNDPASPLHDASLLDVDIEDGLLFLKSAPNRGETYSALLARHGSSPVEARADAKPGEEQKQHSMHAFGADFAEVHVDPDLGQVRVARFVAAFAAGKILNAKTARNQYIGGITWGIGLALMEQTQMDPRLGRIMNADLAEYHVPVNADVPDIEVIFVEERDPYVNPVGVKGIGEIGIVGAPSAIANAVYHATGKRVRDLPITLDKLL